jgi:hypothetical protein
MQGLSICFLSHLLAAAESIGNDESVWRRGPNGRQQHALTDLD